MSFTNMGRCVYIYLLNESGVAIWMYRHNFQLLHTALGRNTPIFQLLGAGTTWRHSAPRVVKVPVEHPRFDAQE